MPWKWESIGGLTSGKVYIRAEDESHPGWRCSEADLTELFRELEPNAMAYCPGERPAGVVRRFKARINELASRVGLLELEGQVSRGGDAEALRARVAELEAEVERKAQVIRDQDESIKSLADQLDEAEDREDQLQADLAAARNRIAELERRLGSDRDEMLMIIGDLYRKAHRVYHADGSHALLGTEEEVARLRVEAAGKIGRAVAGE